MQGPVIVVVEGFHTPPGSEFSMPLFPRHEFKTEIPKGTANLDIVVPERPAGRPPETMNRLRSTSATSPR